MEHNKQISKRSACDVFMHVGIKGPIYYHNKPFILRSLARTRDGTLDNNVIMAKCWQHFHINI